MPKNSRDNKLVSVIIPAFKQEKTIVGDVQRIVDTMTQTRWAFEVIVVVDGFVDKTYEKAKTLENFDVKVVGYKTNRGKGYAVRYGMARSIGDLIVFIDSGMDIDPNGISMVLEHMQWYNADIIVGSKRHPASKVAYPFIRKLYSWVYSRVVRILFGLKITDTQSGLKVFKREVLEKVLPRLLVKQFAFDIEILAVSKYLGFERIYEAPIKIDWIKSNSNFTPLILLDKNIRGMVVDTLAVFYRLRILHYYSDKSKRLWVYDAELDMKLNTGEINND
jgi:glycosyltransferase involved in cell wall biosynthesis